MSRRVIYIKANATGRKKKIIIALIVLAVGIFSGWLLLSRPANTKEDTIPDITNLHTPVIPMEKDNAPTIMAAEITLGHGETMGKLLKRSGVKGLDMPALTKAISRYIDLKKLSVGQKIKVFYDSKTFKFQSIIMPITKIEYIVVKNTPTGYKCELKHKQVKITTLSFACMIRYSFNRSMYNCGADPKLVSTIETLLAQRIDLFRQVRRGDLLRLVIEKVSVSGRFLKYGNILGLTYEGRVVNESAFYFEGRHYDSTGESYERPFLPSPIRYLKVKSGKAAYKKSKKKHRLSIEYSVPGQTKVFAVGDGTVIYAGRDIRLGRLVIVKHKGEYRSYYARLSSREKKVKVGAGISRGQLIGKTGTHPLYFAVSRRGVYRKPSILGQIHGTMIESTQRTAFTKQKEMYEKILKELPVRNSYGP